MHIASNQSKHEHSQGIRNIRADLPDLPEMGHNRQVGPRVHRAGGQDDGSYANSLKLFLCVAPTDDASRGDSKPMTQIPDLQSAPGMLAASRPSKC